MNSQKKKLGLVLGRFQPLHQGHLQLINIAFQENDEMVICIGSAQIADPLHIKERHVRLEGQLEALGYPKDKFRIVDLVDPEPMEIWPRYVKEVCGITDETINTFYRAETLPKNYVADLEKLGFNLRIVDKIPFYYKAPDGLYYLVQSATEIKTIHRRLENYEF